MRRPLRSETGQTTVLVSVMLFTLATFVALVANVGQMVNRRVALQLIADAGAWTGATVQANQLNHYAFWSRMTQNAYKNASAVAPYFLNSECWTGQHSANMFHYANGGMALATTRFFGKARSEAERHSYFNIDDLFPGERDNFSFSTMAGGADGAVGAPLDGNIVAAPLTSGDKLYTGSHEWGFETMGQVLVEGQLKLTELLPLPWTATKAGSFYHSWMCETILPPAAWLIVMTGPSGYKLQKPGQPFIFVWSVKEKRATRALFFDKFFGPNAIPAMTAVAVAKAVGGDVHKGKSTYRAKMVPVSDYSLTAGLINDPLARTDRLVPGSTMRKIVH